MPSAEYLPLGYMTSSDPCQRFFNRLETYHQTGFTGRLRLANSRGSWSIYYKLGNFTWASGGIHPLRRWRRQFMLCCDRLPELSLARSVDESLECWDYNVLNQLLQQQQLSEQQHRSIVCGTILEVLFDLVLAIASGEGSLKVRERAGVRPIDGGSIVPCWDWPQAQARDRVRELWQEWSASNLEHVCPDRALWIRKPADLKARTSANLYEYLEQLADGRHTLRDLAARTRENFMELTRLLAPYLRRRLIDMVDVLDLSAGDTPISKHEEFTSGILEDLEVAPQSLGQSFPRNAMEQLVREEVQTQLRKLPPEATVNLKSIDTFTYALNRLPPLYASTQRGLQIQLSRGKREFGDRIAENVRLAILTLHNRPRSRDVAASSEDLAIAEPSGPLDLGAETTPTPLL